MPRWRRKRKKTLGLLALILIIWAAGVIVIVGFNPFNMQGTAQTPVVVIIQAGSAENPRLGFTTADGSDSN